MIRKEAMDLILKKIKSEPIISANGFISRDLFELKEKNSNFYMIGSMGLSSSIGLGVALKNPKKMMMRMIHQSTKTWIRRGKYTSSSTSRWMSAAAPANPIPPSGTFRIRRRRGNETITKKHETKTTRSDRKRNENETKRSELARKICCYAGRPENCIDVTAEGNGSKA